MAENNHAFEKTPEALRFQQTLALHEAGVEMMRLNLKRRHPEMSKEQIQEKLLRGCMINLYPSTKPVTSVCE